MLSLCPFKFSLLVLSLSRYGHPPLRSYDIILMFIKGSTALAALTAIHAGVVAALFWVLLANALVATQVVEDGTPAALVPFSILTVLIFAGTLYIALDTAFGFTSVFQSTPPQSLHNIGLFVLTCIWPAAATILYFILMGYIVLGMLREVRPIWYFTIAFVLFVLAQLDFFLLNKVICNVCCYFFDILRYSLMYIQGAKHRIDGSFIATILETAAVVVLYYAWRSITEGLFIDPVLFFLVLIFFMNRILG